MAPARPNVVDFREFVPHALTLFKFKIYSLWWIVNYSFRLGEYRAASIMSEAHDVWFSSYRGEADFHCITLNFLRGRIRSSRYYYKICL